MRKLFLCVAVLLCAAFPLTACNVSEMTSLTQFSHPYCGLYRCESLKIGGTECLKGYEYLTLELCEDSAFHISYSKKKGKSGNFSGKYALSEDGDEITFTAELGGKKMQRTFPVHNGDILIQVGFGGRMVYALFRL